MRHPALLSVLALALIAIAGCEYRESKPWRPVEPAAATPPGSPAQPAPAPRLPSVVFAPVALGELAQTIPDAKLGWARDMSVRLNTLHRGGAYEGWWGETLPASDDARWQQANVEVPKGMAFLVLTQVLKFEQLDGQPDIHGTVDNIRATVSMRVYDADGNKVFDKRAQGVAEDRQAMKERAAESSPRAKAAWQACSRLTGALIEWLDRRNEAAELPAPTAPATVEVRFDSTPDGANIVIEDKFRGTTPASIALPPRTVRVRIELPGHLPWEQDVLPTAGAAFKPRLVPTATDAPTSP